MYQAECESERSLFDVTTRDFLPGALRNVKKSPVNFDDNLIDVRTVTSRLHQVL
jgi:hypothetical protein